jgi:hypothetical protein
MLPFVCLKEETDIDPKIAKVLPEEMGLWFYLHTPFQRVNELVITEILDTDK